MRHRYIKTPEGASWSIGLRYSLSDPDEEIGIQITIHPVWGDAACNTWIQERSKWGPLLTERLVTNAEPSAEHLEDELNRVAEHAEVLSLFFSEAQIDQVLSDLTQALKEQQIHLGLQPSRAEGRF